MDNKNIVRETLDSFKVIVKELESADTLFLTDGNDFKILLDSNAINLLKAHYRSKLKWGARFE